MRSRTSNELARLRARLEEAEDTLTAIRSGQVDALVVAGPEGDRIFTLEGPELRYRRLVETMKEGAGVVGRDGTLLYCNQQLSAMLGVPLENLIGDEVTRHVAPVSRKTFEALMREAREGAGKAEIAFRVGGDGMVLPAYVSMSSTGDADGGLCLVATDLSEQKRGEEIVAAERLATSILDQAAEAVVVCDPRGRVVRASQSAHRIAHRNPLLTAFEEAFPLRTDVDDGAPIDIVRKALAGQATSGVDASLLRTAGEQLHVIASAAPLNNARREIVGCVVSLVDITQRKRAEDAVGLLSRAGAALVASMDLDDMLERLTREVVPDFADYCVVYLLDEDDPEAVKLASVRHVRPEKEALLREEARRGGEGGPRLYHRVLRSGRAELVESVSDEALDDLAADGAHRVLLRSIRPRSSAAAPLRAQRRVFGAIVIARTESEERFTPEDLATLEELALRLAVAIDNSRLLDLAQRERARVEEANRAKDEFLAAVSHELRTPLNAILGWARMLRSGQVPEEKRERALETIERNAAIQTQLIEDLLDISRIVTGKLRLHSRPVDIAAVVQAALESVKPQGDAKRVTIESAFGPPIGPVLGDADRLQQIVWNLLTNAIKFTPSGGRVKVTLRAAESRVEIRVTDDGEGISAEFLPHVFERFQQAKGGSARMHGGLGIGLTIVKNLVELHGGTIEALSDGEGRGSSFVIVLPTVGEAEPSATAGAAHSEAPCDTYADLSGLRVLVVDDDDDARELVASLLEECHALPKSAGSAQDAFTQLTSERFDVLVSDIGMPGEDGYSLITRVRTLAPEAGGRIPAVALTAFARGDDRTRALRAGFDMHLPKPVEPAELVAALANLTGRRK